MCPDTTVMGAFKMHVINKVAISQILIQAWKVLVLILNQKKTFLDFRPEDNITKLKVKLLMSSHS